jgi:hypothetical protein
MYIVLPGNGRGKGTWPLLGHLKYDNEGEGLGSGQRARVQCMMEVDWMIWQSCLRWWLENFTHDAVL